VRKRFVFLFPVTVMAMLIVARTAHADEWHKTYTVSGKAIVRVETNDGAVHISTWDGKQIEARVETAGWKISSSEVRIVERQTDDRLDLEARVPNTHWNFQIDHRSLRIELRIPRESDLTVRTGDGNVEIGSGLGAVDIRTGDGHIMVNGAKGDVRLSTGDGHIQATNLDGRLDASSGDGHIQVDGRFDLLNLKTNDGAIDARLSNGSRITTSWLVRSGDGNVTLHFPENFQADLDAHTGDGRINLDFPISVMGNTSRSAVRGKINGGGSMLTVRTGDGSINILKH
jgi:DUF4097 and DUF4098 domain-containing protein YvlB